MFLAPDTIAVRHLLRRSFDGSCALWRLFCKLCVCSTAQPDCCQTFWLEFLCLVPLIGRLMCSFYLVTCALFDGPPASAPLECALGLAIHVSICLTIWSIGKLAASL